MTIYAIGDLHLSGAVNKPMDIFGSNWVNHWHKIKEDWNSHVTGDDIVLIPGDISWGMQLQEAIPDLEDIGSLPGIKIMIKGNHDYWWSSISKVRNVLPPSVYALQNDSLSINGYTFCGTRGWLNPGMREFGQHDHKIYSRELQRLSLSLNHAKTKENLIVLIHFPPFDDRGLPTEVVNLLSQYKPLHVVYGHLHGEGTKYAFDGIYNDTYYHLVSCDYLDFQLKKIL